MKNTQRKNNQTTPENRTERKAFDLPPGKTQQNNRIHLDQEDAGGTSLGHKKSQETGSDKEIRKQ